MRQKGINRMEWIDGEEEKKKIKIETAAQKDLKTLILWTYIPTATRWESILADY